MKNIEATMVSVCLGLLIGTSWATDEKLAEYTMQKIGGTGGDISSLKLKY